MQSGENAKADQNQSQAEKKPTVVDRTVDEGWDHGFSLATDNTDMHGFFIFVYPIRVYQCYLWQKRSICACG